MPINKNQDLPQGCATDKQCDGFMEAVQRQDCPPWLRTMVLSILNRAAYFEAQAEILEHTSKATQSVFDRAMETGAAGSMAASSGTIDGGRPFLMVVGVGDGAEALHRAVSRIATMTIRAEFPPITDQKPKDKNQ